MFRNGILAVLRFPYGTYSTSIPFPIMPFLIFVNCTFTITAPSFRCKFTFFPRKDLALFKLKFSIAFHQSASFSAMLVQHCLQMGSFSPLKRIYSLMFSLSHLCFQGFLQRSKHVSLQGYLKHKRLAFSAFKTDVATDLEFCGEV